MLPAQYLASNSGLIFFIESYDRSMLAPNTAASWFFCLDVGDWSLLLLGVASTGLLVMLLV